MHWSIHDLIMMEELMWTVRGKAWLRKLSPGRLNPVNLCASWLPERSSLCHRPQLPWYSKAKNQAKTWLNLWALLWNRFSGVAFTEQISNTNLDWLCCAWFDLTQDYEPHESRCWLSAVFLTTKTVSAAQYLFRIYSLMSDHPLKDLRDIYSH